MERRVKVALFVTCLGDAMTPQVGTATVALLRRLGIKVEFPRAQSCCGQMHVNTGYPRLAVNLIRRHVRAFDGYDAVVAPSASCVGSVRHQHATVARSVGDDRLAADAEALADRTFELSEFLVDVLGTDDVGAYYPHRVSYHPTCHSLRLLRVGDRPLRLLRHVEGLDLVELPAADSCCGFGGTFAVKNAAVSTAMLHDKCVAITATGADRVAAGDSSCLLHIGGGLSRADSPTRPVHLAEILAGTREGAPTP